MSITSSLDFLINTLRRLPGIGPRFAQRIAYYLLQGDRETASILAKALNDAVNKIHQCIKCNTFSENDLCLICSDPYRKSNLLCVVETPADQLTIEQTMIFKGKYFILMGHLSPIEGIGPKDLNLEKLVKRANDGIVEELVLATNFTNEGEATAHFISEKMKKLGLKVTRLARGVPMGGELEYVDIGTIARAIVDRKVN